MTINQICCNQGGSLEPLPNQHLIPRPKQKLSWLTAPFSRLIKRLDAQWKLHQLRRTDRQAFQQYLTLEDHVLDDIGVTRADVIWASELPLATNASVELEKIRQNNNRPAKGRARPKQRN